MLLLTNEDCHNQQTAQNTEAGPTETLLINNRLDISDLDNISYAVNIYKKIKKFKKIFIN